MNTQHDPTDTEQLAEAIAEIIREAQVTGRTEYKRRVGFNGRLSIAHAILASDLLAEVANQARREALQEAAQQASMNFPGSTTISGVRLRDWLETQADDDRADTPHA